jgi:hypothetical protein
MRLPISGNLNSFFAIELLPKEAFIHHSVTAVVRVLYLPKDPIRLGVADNQSIGNEHFVFLSCYIPNIQQKGINVHP